jgi:hypothetical protein
MNSSRSNSAYGFYPQHGYNDSYDANAQHSDGTGPWANSTDPSSENSSLDRANGVPKQTDPYGHDIYNGPPIMEEYARHRLSAHLSSSVAVTVWHLKAEACRPPQDPLRQKRRRRRVSSRSDSARVEKAVKKQYIRNDLMGRLGGS